MSNGVSNGPGRGNSTDRRRRKEWLIREFRADVDLLGELEIPVPRGQGEPAVRCYRCGVLLTLSTVTADRIDPGIRGGSYKRANLRPACARCQSVTGNEIKRALRSAS